VKHKQLPAEALVDLRRRLADLAPRSAERRVVMQETASLYGISESSLYRALRERARPKALQRADQGVPRILPRPKFERFCEVIAALKIRTSNKKGRHLTPGGLARQPPSGRHAHHVPLGAFQHLRQGAGTAQGRCRRPRVLRRHTL
jgi:hypothetical protein